MAEQVNRGLELNSLEQEVGRVRTAVAGSVQFKFNAKFIFCGATYPTNDNARN